MEQKIERGFGILFSACAAIAFIYGIIDGRNDLYFFAFTIGFFGMMLFENSEEKEDKNEIR